MTIMSFTYFQVFTLIQDSGLDETLLVNMCAFGAPEPIYYFSQRAIDYTWIQERHLLTLIRQNLVDVQACNYL